MVTSAERRETDAHAYPGAVYNVQLRQCCQTLLGRLKWPGASKLRTLGVTSCLSGEGVSTISAHLAATAASAGDGPVLLVDANRSRPSVHRTFGTVREPGLDDLLHASRELDGIVRQTSMANLSVLTAGMPPQDLHSPFESETFSKLLKRLADGYPLIVFDLPPVGHAGSNLDLACRLDGVLLVVEAERVRWEVARRTLEDLDRAGVKLLGTTLNKRPSHIPNWLYRRL